jgi:large subunit ribosomal protein L24
VAKLHVKKGDRVLILTGKEKGKKGKIIRVLPAKGRVVVEGLNIVKKHARATQRVQAGIYEQEAPIDSSNVMVICPSCKEPTRIKKSPVQKEEKTVWLRACKKCGELLEK